MDRLNGTIQSQLQAELLESQVGLVPQQGPHLPPMGVEDLGFATAVAVAGLDASGMPPLLDELLDHAEGHFKTPGDLVTGRITPVVGLQNSLPEIQ